MSEIHIHGPIGADHGGITARHVIEQLHAGARRIRIHSEGGCADTALQIANAIEETRRQGRRVEATIEGLCASAATVVSSACHPIRIVSHGLMMIHEPRIVPSTTGTPTAQQGQEARSVIARITDAIVRVYRRCAKKSESELRAMMQATTWMDADESIAAGFATEKIAGLRVAACLSSPLLAQLGDVPARYRSRFDALIARGIDPTAIYAARNHGWDRAFDRTSGRRPRTFGDLAGEQYGGQAAEARDLIATSRRGGY